MTTLTRRSRPTLVKPHWNPQTPSLKTRSRWLRRILTWWEMRRLPEVTGPADLNDLWPPGRTSGASIPAYYLFQPVHHMPQPGWLRGRMGPRSEMIRGDFAFATAANIHAWILDNVADAGLSPRHILDVGTGAGHTASVYAELFPNAEVIGVDLSPSMLRWGQRRAAERGLVNLRFYHADAADLSCFEDESFDIVHEANMLHEMPARHIEASLREMVRVCRTGGLLGFFDWAIPETETDWQHREWKVRSQGEPFMLEYARFDFPRRLAELGCLDVVRVERHSNSATWKGVKGPAANRRLAALRHSHGGNTAL